VVSLFKTATEMDRLEELYRTAIDSLAAAVGSTAQYATEVHPGELEQFRLHLETLEKLIHFNAPVEELRGIKSSFRGELREYQQQVHHRIESLRQEVKSAAAAMQTFADGLVANSTDHESQVEQELQTLATVSKADDLWKIRGGIHEAIGNIASSIEEMRRGNQVVVALLQDEIRTLHREIQSERRAHATDRATGAWNREKLTDRIEALFLQNEAFCVLLIRMRNLKQLEQRYSRNVVEGTLKAVLMRLHQIAGADSMIGRWSLEEFAVILPIEPPDAIALSREVTNKLTGEYSVQENGLSRTVSLQVVTGIVERRGGVVSDSFLRNVEQLGLTMAHG